MPRYTKSMHYQYFFIVDSRAIRRKGEKKEKVSKREEMLTREIDTPGL